MLILKVIASVKDLAVSKKIASASVFAILKNSESGNDLKVSEEIGSMSVLLI